MIENKQEIIDKIVKSKEFRKYLRNVTNSIFKSRIKEDEEILLEEIPLES